MPRCLVDTQLVNWYFKPYDTAPFLTHLNGVIQAKVRRDEALDTWQARLFDMVASEMRRPPT